VIYDLERHKTHSLNPTAAAVWRMCDGQTPPEVMAERLGAGLGLHEDDAASIARMALERLDKANLLQERVKKGSAALTRRQVIKRVGIAALVPLVVSIATPMIADAQLCITTRNNCPPGSPLGRCYFNSGCGGSPDLSNVTCVACFNSGSPRSWRAN
jgi:hypothetical protein